MKYNRWVGIRSAVSMCAAVGVLLSGAGIGRCAESPPAAKPDLTGTVKDQDGQPLRDAGVFIYTAGPKEGAGLLCPSCYADCRKRATTDAAGHFKIESLDPTLLFRVLVVANGHRPKFVAKVDPAVKPVEVALQPNKEGAGPDRQLKGRVIDTQGKPIAGAVISLRGVSRGESTRFGGNEDVDQMAVTDNDGAFVINGESSFTAAGVDVEAAGYAKGVFQHLATGEKVHELKLTEGATVKGRLVKNGKPVPGVTMGICGADRNSEIFVGDFSVGTDKEGRFLLVNLPPNREYILYATMESLAHEGAAQARHLRLADDGSVMDAGDIQVTAGFKLEGKIRLTDGKPVPPNTRVMLSRDGAWDTAETKADDQGRFAFQGVPAESIRVSAGIKGHHFSSHNRSLNPMDPYELMGTLKADKTDLILEFEPGKDDPRPRGEYVDIRQEPLIGAEGGRPRTGDIHVTGTVIDADTQKPLAAFTITEGHAGQIPNTIEWLNTRQTEGTNGRLDLFLTRRGTAAAIAVEAEGYLPQSSGLITGTETNFTFALKKGAGPAGVVLKPDGEPATNVAVYLADMRNGVYVQDKDMKVQDRVYQGTRSTKTDAQGRFHFKPRVDDYAVLVLEDEGFAQVLVGELRQNPEVKLRPWARIEGTLRIGAKPGTNESVRLGLAFLPYEFHPRNFSPLSLFLQTETDGEGRFVFDRVPPINVQVYHAPKVKEGRMGIIPTSQTTSFSLKPGEVKTITVGGQGRPVTGQMTVDGYEGEIDWRADVQTLELISPPIDDAPDMGRLIREHSAKIQAAATDEEKQRLIAEMDKVRADAIGRQQAFYQTDKGREFYFQHSKHYVLNFETNGAFRIEDVPGGKYKLRMDLREPGADGPARFSAPAIAHLEKEFEVPDSPGGRTDEPFDLGKIKLQAKKVLSAGKPAPAFTVKTVDDKTVKLSDFAGKYVLVDFWAVWCGPCKGETPFLKATYDAFKDDPRFRMIGLSLDPVPATPKDYAAKNEMPWTMGFLGEWSKTDLPTQYGVDGIPAIFLIGPDGKIIAKGLRGESIKATVERTLGSQSAKAQ